MAVIFRTALLPGEREWLAGNASREEVDSVDSCGPKSVSVEGFEVMVEVCLWKMTRQHALAVAVYLAEGTGLKTCVVGRDPERPDPAAHIHMDWSLMDWFIHALLLLTTDIIP